MKLSSNLKTYLTVVNNQFAHNEGSTSIANVIYHCNSCGPSNDSNHGACYQEHGKHSCPKITMHGKRVQPKKQVFSPLKTPTNGIFLPTNSRQTPPIRSHILIGMNVFDVESDSNDGCFLGNLMEGSGTSEVPSPSPKMGGMVHLIEQPPW